MSELDSSELQGAPAPVEEPVVEPVLEAAADEPAELPAEEPAEEPAPEPVKAKSGMLEELIGHRNERRRLEKQIEALQPVLSRLTPELQEAISEGRVVLKPKPTSSDERTAQLEATARKLNLFKADGETPDIDAASRVDTYVRDVARAETAPLREARTTDQATHNFNVAMETAKANGYSPEVTKIIEDTFRAAPHGVIANSDIAMTTWELALGRAVAKGLNVGRATAAARKAEPAPAAIISEGTGRRGPSSSVTLSPAIARMYKNEGLDPTKTRNAGKKYDLSQSVELE